MLHYAFIIFLMFGTQQDQTEIMVEADRVEYSRDGNVTTWTREDRPVVATHLDMRLEADTLALDKTVNVVTADGHVRYTRGDDENLRADHIVLDLSTKSGEFKNVMGEVGPGVFLTAEEVHRTEDGRYEIRKGTVSTCCDSSEHGWTLTAASAVVDPHRRYVAKGSLFRLEGFPIFYMPYVVIPSTDRARSTGFLIPSTSSTTTKGRSIRESFYWAINRSADATFSGEYFSKRGPAGAVQFRARPDKGSWIQIDSLFAQDRKDQGGQSARILGFGNIGRGFRGVADMNLVSSFVFRQVYEDGLNVISSPLQHTLAFVTRNSSNASVNFLFSRDGIFFADQPTVVLRKFPSLEVSLPSRRMASLPLYFRADTSFSGIERRDANITTPGFVQRLDVHPVVQMPVVQSSLLTWSQSLGIQETAYTHSRQSQLVLSEGLNRFSLDYRSNVIGPQLERDFGSLRHVIEPSVDFRYVGGADQFRDTIVVDDVDLVARTKEVEYAVTNRFFTSREVFSWRLAQKYYFDPTFGGAIIPGKRNVFAPVLDISGFAFADGVRRVSPIVSTMRVSTSAYTSTDVEVDYDTRDHLFRSAGVVGNASRGQVVGGVSYFFTRRSAIEIPSNQLRGSISYGNRLKPGLSAAVSFSYDVQHSLFQGSTAEVGYNTNCYGIFFEVTQYNSGARVETGFRFAFTLKDIGSAGTLRPRERLF
jgi:LPS-assembly protein